MLYQLVEGWGILAPRRQARQVTHKKQRSGPKGHADFCCVFEGHRGLDELSIVPGERAGKQTALPEGWRRRARDRKRPDDRDRAELLGDPWIRPRIIEASWLTKM